MLRVRIYIVASSHIGVLALFEVLSPIAVRLVSTTASTELLQACIRSSHGDSKQLPSMELVAHSGSWNRAG